MDSMAATNFWAFWDYVFLYNPVWKWLAVLGLLLGGLVLGKTLSFLLDKQQQRLTARGKNGAAHAMWRAFTKPVQLASVAGALYICQSFLTLTPEIRQMWIRVTSGAVAFAGAWAVYRLVDVAEHLLGRFTKRTDTRLDDQLAPLLRKSLRIFVVILATLFIADNVFQWDVGSLVAGLGIGGLAFALAAKDSLANLFGSAVIFADQPFSMGERVKIQGSDGLVEQVGFRSTRIRTLDGNLVTIPNNTVANEVIENIGRRPTIKRVLNVSLTYDTPPDRMQRAVDILREMLDARAEHFPEDLPGRVYFSEFNADNLNIVVYYWFGPPDWWEYLDFTHDFNMELLRRFNEEGLEFAFPTQTLYLKPEGAFELGGLNAPQPKEQT